MSSAREGPPAASPGYRKIALGVALAALVIAFFALGGHRYLSLDAVKTHRDALLAFTREHYLAALAIAFATYVGATLVFLAARYLFADAARRRMGALGEKISAGFTENALNYLLFLRLVPLFPFFLVNLAPAFTNIRLVTFVVGTFVGIIPATFVYVNLGETLGRIDSLSGLVSVQTVGAFVLLGLLALVPVLVRKWRASRTAGA